MATLAIGTRVRLVRDVDRFPDFTAKAGATGIVTTNAPDFFAVKLDVELDGAEGWDNEVHWHGEMLADISAEVEVV